MRNIGEIRMLSFKVNKIITTSMRDNVPHYQHSEVGYNYRMSNICAGIGRGHMEALDAMFT